MEPTMAHTGAGRPEFLERSFTVVAILLSTGAFANLWMTPERFTDLRVGDVLQELFWVATYALSAVLLWRHSRGSFRQLVKEKWILALVALALSSAAWSEVPMVTLRHGIALGAGCLFSLYFVERFTFAEQLKILGWVFGLAAILSFIFGALDWGTAVLEVPGTWIGIYAHKNVLGGSMALGALVFSLLSEHLENGKWLAWLGLVSCLILIILSRSMTAIVIVLPLLYAKHLIRLALQGKPKIGRKVCVALLVVAVSGAWIVSDFDRVTELLDRDPTLTGRTMLWAIIFPMALQKPWLGYGFGGFWLGEEGPSVEVWELHGFPTPNGHNGLLDILLDLGLIGAITAACGYIFYSRNALRVFAADHSWQNAWPLLFLLTLFLLNIAETDFLAPNSFYWFAYVTTALSLSRRTTELQSDTVPSLIAPEEARA